jgi:glutamate-1-semialdehyde 2,1-aminomutase
MRAAGKLDRSRLHALMRREERRFVVDHPKSGALFERAKRSMLGGVPMHWMVKWAGAFPIFVDRASGARFVDVDGREYVDLCLGDTGAMTGHAPAATVAAIRRQLDRGITFMLPTEDALWVGEELTRRFGLSYWQFALTATDANRFSIRLAREITRRPFVLVFNGCYHGTVDETFISLVDGEPVPRRGNIGPPVNPVETTRVVEFNDVDALERAMADGLVACVLAEPVMTNVGIVHPEPGYHTALRAIAKRHGSLLIIDETHTLCAGPGGYTRAFGLEPDMLVVGKTTAGGIPAAAYGFTRDVGERVAAHIHKEDCDTGGIGGTLAGNALSLAAMRSTLADVLTDEAFARMMPIAQRFETGVREIIDRYEVPWHVTRLGCRAEYLFKPQPARNGGEAMASADHELDRFMHLYSLNRGILMTPFHNMALVCPATTQADIDVHTQAFGDAVRELTSAREIGT